ncbi:MAG: hypothetical protein PHH37_11265 [Paludibacter sp.]|nr:hypothetical protein [Paludibacter sp.]
MENLNVRFLDFYRFLLQNRIVKNAKDFTERLSVSSSFMTEIKKGRSNVGTKIIQNAVIEFGLNANWLFSGDGEKIQVKDEKSSMDGVDFNTISFILNRYEELVSENTLLKIENEKMKKSLEI